MYFKFEGEKILEKFDSKCFKNLLNKYRFLSDIVYEGIEINIGDMKEIYFSDHPKEVEQILLEKNFYNSVPGRVNKNTYAAYFSVNKEHVVEPIGKHNQECGKGESFIDENSIDFYLSDKKIENFSFIIKLESISSNDELEDCDSAYGYFPNMVITIIDLKNYLYRLESIANLAHNPKQTG